MSANSAGREFASLIFAGYIPAKSPIGLASWPISLVRAGGLCSYVARDFIRWAVFGTVN